MSTPVQSGNSTKPAKPATLPAAISPTGRKKPTNRATFESPQDRFARHIMEGLIMTAGGIPALIGKGIAYYKNSSNPERELKN